MQYSRTYMTKEELETMLIGRIGSIELNRIISAYEMADFGYGDSLMEDGSSLFFHTTRVCKILINEMLITDSVLLSSSLLYDIYRYNDEITPSIISYNFGTYTAYLLEILCLDYKLIPDSPSIADFQHGFGTPNPRIDYLTIWLAIHLDNLRCLYTGVEMNLIRYYFAMSEKLLPIAKESDNEVIKKLLNKIQSEKNKISG
jgi:(p)ppGpp synthase/HD superfamily hydrolase